MVSRPRVPLEISAVPSDKSVLLAMVLTLLLAGFACSGDIRTEPTPVPAEPASPAQSPPVPPGMPDLITVALASTDIAVGANRVAFALIRPGQGPVRNAQVEVRTFLLKDSGPEGPRQTVPAEFQVWPGGAGGVYVANLTFDDPGEWGLGFAFPSADGSETQAGTRVQVKSTSATPAVGTAAPRSQNKTSHDVGDLQDLTTDGEPDPDLYMKTIADALGEDRPLLVSFSTPAYCKTGICGPQLEVVKELKRKHSGRMNFIHIEVYDNPPEIRDNGIDAAKISPTLAEWGLPTEPWTFVIDAGGIIRAKFEGFVGPDELESAVGLVFQ